MLGEIWPSVLDVYICSVSEGRSAREHIRWYFTNNLSFGSRPHKESHRRFLGEIYGVNLRRKVRFRRSEVLMSFGLDTERRSLELVGDPAQI